MVFEYLECTRRQLAEMAASHMPQDISKKERAKILKQEKNAMGDITDALNLLGADNWELVSIIEARDYGGELLYTFKR